MIGRKQRFTLIAAAAFAAGVTAWACADPSEPPNWEVAKDNYDAGGSSAVLTPGNDTRVNLLLLLADRHGKPPRLAGATQEGLPPILFPWSVMFAATEPARPESEQWQEWSPTRCQSNAGGGAAFVAAVRADGQVPEAEKARLVAARTAFVPDCSGQGAASPAVAAASPAGRAFADYLTAAADFYGERFAPARATFAALAKAQDPWLRETALYMVARTELNRALAGSFEEYGSLAPPEKRDNAAIAAARAGFQAYLKAYPKGRYAPSARGLTRRVAWLAGDEPALAAAFDREVAAPEAYDGAPSPAQLAQEIDTTLLIPGSGTAARDPLLVAVADLSRMRCPVEGDSTDGSCAHLGKEELDRQAPLFAKEPALFAYLRASEAYYGRHAPKEVLALIPDAAHQRRFTYLEFSRQMLRGFALEASKDRNTRGFWLSLFGGAVQPYQREALELALALHDERSGHVERVFAPDSKVRHPVIRQILIEDVAGPELLRQQARDAKAPKQERDVAAFVLLSKDLRGGFYRDFLGDLPLMPASVREPGWYGGARSYDPRYNPKLDPPPLARFLASAPLGEGGCPALKATVAQLAQAPQAIGPRLCLAEYFRSNGFDDFEIAWPERGTGLGSSASQFPNRPYARLEVYKAIVGNADATAEQRAWALNRAIRCYAPGGANSCGGTDVPVEQRRAWFQRLKRDYPKSRWAQTLKLYW